jgi:hypothetical protein
MELCYLLNWGTEQNVVSVNVTVETTTYYPVAAIRSVCYLVLFFVKRIAGCCDGTPIIPVLGRGD